MKYISRIDANNTHCYTVRVGYKMPEAIHKTFSDGVYGNAEKALRAAIRYRNKEAKRLKVTLNKRYHYDVNAQRHWGDGAYLAKDNRHDPVKTSWRAFYWDNKKGKQLTKQFSVNKYGTRLAKRLALQWRKLKITGKL